MPHSLWVGGLFRIFAIWTVFSKRHSHNSFTSSPISFEPVLLKLGYVLSGLSELPDSWTHYS